MNDDVVTEQSSVTTSVDIVSDSTQELLAFARLIAGQVWHRYQTLDPDDIASEICVYVLSHDRVLAEWQDYCEGDYDSEESAKHASNRIRTIFRRAGERYARKEIAAMVGYRPEDEAYYSTGLLKVLVEQYYAEGLTERPPVGRAESVAKSSGDPATAGNYLISLLDVQRGLELLPAKYRNRLKFRFKDLGQVTDAEIARMADNLAVAPGKRQRIAKHLGYSEDQIRGRVRIALRKLQSKLGGSSPYVRDHREQAEPAMI